jgi:hypothetical protein
MLIARTTTMRVLAANKLLANEWPLLIRWIIELLRFDPEASLTLSGLASLGL